MNREALGLLLIALLFGGVVLLARRPAVASNYSPASLQPYSQDIKVIPVGAEPRRYQNKETRRIEYNADNLPTLIEITRDYTIT
jgi:hypothetical protein